MSDYKAYSDEQLTELFRSGDELAFTEIYNRHSVPLLYHVNQMLRDRESAKDIVQDLFTSIWSMPENLKTEANLAGYLYIAARNRVFNLMEKGRVRNEYVKSIAKYITEASIATLNEIDERELSQIINEEINALPPRMKEVFELSRKENLSYLQIAERLNISDKTVKKQISKALTVLRKKVGPYTSTGLIILLLQHPSTNDEQTEIHPLQLKNILSQRVLL